MLSSLVFLDPGGDGGSSTWDGDPNSSLLAKGAFNPVGTGGGGVIPLTFEASHEGPVYLPCPPKENLRMEARTELGLPFVVEEVYGGGVEDLKKFVRFVDTEGDDEVTARLGGGGGGTSGGLGGGAEGRALLSEL
jgi:hypothetical protein